MLATVEPVPYLTERLQGFGTTIFTAMSALAIETQSVNLGQGFPDTDGPVAVSQAAIDAIKAGHNQYPPLPGIEPLRTAVAEHRLRFRGQRFDPASEVLITAGATEALAAALATVVNLLDIEIVVLGGGMAERLGPAFRDDLVQRLASRTFAGRLVPIRTAETGDNSGALGAALLVEESRT